jgi:hypothetical protein
MPISQPRNGSYGSQLLDEILSIRDEIAGYADGIPTIDSVIVVKRLDGGLLDYMEITPRPQIIVPSSNFEAHGNLSAIKKELPDYTVKQISRRYQRDELIGSGIYYILYGILMHDGRVDGGIKCDVVQNGLIEEALGWQMNLSHR